MPVLFPSEKAEWALLNLLDGLWYIDDNPVLLEFETADEAVAAWHLRDIEGTFSISTSCGTCWNYGRGSLIMRLKG